MREITKKVFNKVTSEKMPPINPADWERLNDIWLKSSRDKTKEIKKLLEHKFKKTFNITVENVISDKDKKYIESDFMPMPIKRIIFSCNVEGTVLYADKNGLSIILDGEEIQKQEFIPFNSKSVELIIRLYKKNKLIDYYKNVKINNIEENYEAEIKKYR